MLRPLERDRVRSAPAKRYECDECVPIGSRLGAPADLPGVRRDALLRQLAEPAREQARAATTHPVIASAEPGERWLYCYPDDAFDEY